MAGVVAAVLAVIALVLKLASAKLGSLDYVDFALGSLIFIGVAVSAYVRQRNW